MSIIKFDFKEIEMIEKSIELRKESNQGNIGHLKELDSILKQLKSPIIYLKPMQKSILTGCIRVSEIYPKEELIEKSEYEIMLSQKEIQNECIQLDMAFGILDKLKKKTEPKSRFFKTTFEKIEKIRNSQKVYYSITNDGKIYKAGIVIDKNKGLKTELVGAHSLTNFNFEKLHKDSFMKIGKPNEIINHLELYGVKNELTEGQDRLKNILEKVSI